MVLTIKDEPVIGFGDDNDTPDIKAGGRKKTGGFQGMGLNPTVLKGITKKGYKLPTPIQRKTIPLILEGRDLVAMARTGSGKTACFLVPMFEKLKTHSTKSGFRALILSPTRELAIQTLKFIKEIGKFTGLRAAVVIGGDSIDTQFDALHNSPDIVVATPGRFLHVCVEMELKLNNVEYVVFDEADRIFEMGFGEQLREIIARLPDARQTLLFSATLPKVLVEFARAGLSDPVLVRLDVDTKIPDTLTLHFVSCRSDEKAATLLCLLKHVVNPKSKTIVFAATKHHVEYLHCLLGKAGISSTFIYSDLDPSARKINTAKFQSSNVKVLIVTDVAARGIDIPLLDNVINYNFPAKAKLFVHRVGRCARAGRLGHAYSIVGPDEICFLLDLHLFLGQSLDIAEDGLPSTNPNALAKVPQNLLESQLSQIVAWEEEGSDLDGLKKTATNGYKQYLKSRPGASRESVKRAKDVSVEVLGDHALFANVELDETSRAALVAGIHSYRPLGTIFEIGQSAKSEAYQIMKKHREKTKGSVLAHRQKAEEHKAETSAKKMSSRDVNLESSEQNDIQSTFSNIIQGKKRNQKVNVQQEPEPKKKRTIDKDYYIPYQAPDHHTEDGLAINNFQKDATAATLDLNADTENALKSAVTKKVWDKRKKKFVGVETVGKSKMVKSESGSWIPATYKSGRYKQWLEKTKKNAENSEGSDDEETQAAIKKQPHTHWGRHNIKMAQKKQKSELKRPDQIVRARIEKDKKRAKHGRKKRRGMGPRK